tara:strand:- start:235 stop:1974 length:1740 start_codon:yes stop_codon:yes gene_type:complete
MSSLDQFNILLERMETLDEMADSFKRTVKGAAGGEDGLNVMLKAYRNEKTGKPVGAVSRIKNLIVLRALYDKDYINDEQFQSLTKKATSSNYIANTLKDINPEAHEVLFGVQQKSDDIIKHIKVNARDMLNFGLTNLQGKTYAEVQEDEPVDTDAKKLEDEVTDEVIRLAKGLTSSDVEDTILDFDEADIYIDIPDQNIKRDVSSKITDYLNKQGLEAGVSGVGVNVQAPVGFYGDKSMRDTFRDMFTGKVMEIDGSIPEDAIKVKFTDAGGTYEDNESDNRAHGSVEEHYPVEKDPRAAAAALRDAEDARQYEKDKAGPTIPGEYPSDEEDSLEARVQAALSSGGIDKSDARDIQRNSDAAFENILSPAIESARQDPGMDYADVKGVIEAELGRKCTEDECKDIKHDLYNMHGEEGNQERAEAVLDAEDAEGMENKYTVIENDEDGSIEPMSYRQPEGKLIKTVKSDGLIKRCYQHPEGREWTVESDDEIDFDREGSWTWDEESNVEDAETVTENFENQRHLNVTTNSTSMYLTEQASKDARNKGSRKDKDSNQSQSFKERYKPKTHWQLEELRRYGL